MNISKPTKYILVLLILVGFVGCDLVDPNRINDPNNPSVSEVLQNANQAQLQNLVSGLEVRHRNSAVGAVDFIGSFGREFYPMYASDPRFMGRWLGTDADADAENSASFYQNGQVWTVPYQSIKQANILIESVNNTDEISQQQKNGYIGVAQTIKAYQYLIPLLTQSESNGIRIDVEDPLNPGPFKPFDDALSDIRTLLNDAQSNLQNAGSNFAFDLTGGLSSFNTPSTFIQLNRAIAARAAIYAEDWSGALQAVQNAAPFFELAQGETVMNKGAYFTYSGPPGSFNPYFYPRDAATNQILMVHPSMVADAEAGDERVDNKFYQRNNPVTLDGKSSLYQGNRLESNTDPFPWIRNEELILIYAEALAQLNRNQSDRDDAVEAINYVRNTWGLADFTNTSSKSAIIDQILFERRYSLWGEFGHRWIDAKRYGRLNQLPPDGGKIYQYIARPLSEINWEEFNS